MSIRTFALSAIAGLSITAGVSQNIPCDDNKDLYTDEILNILTGRASSDEKCLLSAVYTKFDHTDLTQGVASYAYLDTLYKFFHERAGSPAISFGSRYYNRDTKEYQPGRPFFRVSQNTMYIGHHDYLTVSEYVAQAGGGNYRDELSNDAKIMVAYFDDFDAECRHGEQYVEIGHDSLLAWLSADHTRTLKQEDHYLDVHSAEFDAHTTRQSSADSIFVELTYRYVTTVGALSAVEREMVLMRLHQIYARKYWVSGLQNNTYTSLLTALLREQFHAGSSIETESMIRLLVPTGRALLDGKDFECTIGYTLLDCHDDPFMKDILLGYIAQAREKNPSMYFLEIYAEIAALYMPAQSIAVEMESRLASVLEGYYHDCGSALSIDKMQSFFRYIEGRQSCGIPRGSYSIGLVNELKNEV